MQFNLGRKFSAGGRHAFLTNSASCPVVAWAGDSWQGLGTKVEEFRAGASTECPSSQDVSLMHISGGVSSGSIWLVRKGQREQIGARFPWGGHHLLGDSVRALGRANMGSD